MKNRNVLPLLISIHRAPHKDFGVFCCYWSDILKSLVFWLWCKGETWLWNVRILQNQEALYSRKEHITSLCGKILVIMLKFHHLLCLGRLFSQFSTLFSNTVHNKSFSLLEISIPKTLGFWSAKLYFFFGFFRCSTTGFRWERYEY